MEKGKFGLLNLLYLLSFSSFPQTFVYRGTSQDNQTRTGIDSVEIVADTGGEEITVQRIYQRELSPEEKRNALIDLESKILSPQLHTYQRRETVLAVSSGVEIPDYLKNKYQEVIQ